MERLPDVELEVPTRPEYVGVVRHVVGAVARLGDHSREFIENAKLAGSEACTNAVAVTGGGPGTEPVRVRAYMEGDRLEIDVADRRPGEGQVASPAEPDEFAFDRGLSLPLLEGLVDDLEIAPREGGGTEIRMTLIDDVEEEQE